MAIEMENMELAVYTSLLILLLFIFSTSFLFRGKKYSNRLPPGSWGLPLIGQTFEYLKAMKEDKLKEWFEERISKYGPVSKARLFGDPSVLLHGTAVNKFLYTSAEDVLINTQPPSLSRIVGPKNIMELIGPDHKKVRAAIVSFLKVEVLKQQVAKVDEEIQDLLQIHVHGKHEVQVQPLLKTMTFNLVSSLLFGIEKGPKRERMIPLFELMFEEHEEIANSKGPGEALTWEDLSNMKYTWRVASEIMRMYPPVSMGIRRANKDIEYEGFIIPKGWQVIVSSAMTHLDNNIFSNPTMFDPTRFENKPPPFTLIGFGDGARMCPGIELSRMETVIIIHRLVTQFKWELVKKDESFKRVPNPIFDQGLLVRIKPIE